MNLEDLAALMGKSVSEVRAMLDKKDVVEVKITDSKPSSSYKESGSIVLMR